jgi:hypothetical protein
MAHASTWACWGPRCQTFHRACTQGLNTTTPARLAWCRGSGVVDHVCMLDGDYDLGPRDSSPYVHILPILSVTSGLRVMAHGVQIWNIRQK